jgi:SH3-like domain-containing protein
MPNKTYATLWKITGLAAVGLLIATLILAYQAWSQPQADLIARVTGPNPTVYLRAEPYGTSQIVTILERGSTVQVLDSVIDQDVRWLKIESGNFSGWIAEANIVFESQ